MHRFNYFRPTSIALISRAKVSEWGIGRHYGMALQDSTGYTYSVVHLTYDRGIREVSFEEFQAHREVRWEAEVFNEHQIHEACQRLAVAVHPGVWKYDLAGRNCEHFARWIIFGQVKSDQVSQLAFFSMMGFLIYAFSKAS